MTVPLPINGWIQPVQLVSPPGPTPPSGVIPVRGVPGVTITSPDDTTVGIGATQPLPSAPAGTRRATVQVTGGDDTTVIRVREVGGNAGAGRLLIFLGSTMYGGADGAIADLEVENVTGPSATVSITFEGN